ncbi:MAG: NADH-quinone oxidoreductase subunit NuoH [Bacteroidota bacterium]
MISFLFYLGFLLGFVVGAVYVERKIAAFIQARLGPMEVGPKGLFQTIADLVKMLQKQDVRPASVDLVPFLIAPIIVFASVFAGYAVLPVNAEIGGSGIGTGLFFLLAIVSLDILGILMAGWASNNKFSLFGSMRSVAQIVSYEIPLGLSALSVVLYAGTLDLQEMCFLQNEGILSWNIVRCPLLLPVFIIFFIAGLAESNRTPFDLPESESELIGGFQTEYSGFRWGMFMLAEYGMMLLVALFGAVLFFGGWSSPVAGFADSVVFNTFWLIAKASVLIFIMMWIRWTLPRLRVDQLMNLSWKYLTPASVLLLFAVAGWKLWVIT